MFFSVPSVVFWFGDLNFRIEDYDIHVVKCAIDSNKLPLLWERDQVRHLPPLKTFAPLLEGFYTTCLSLDRQPRPTEGAVAQSEETPTPVRLE